MTVESGSPRSNRVDVSWAPWGAVCLALCATTFMTLADTDLWGHLRFGLDALSTHTLPSQDTYSFTQDLPWINHEWLSELWMAFAYHSGGPAGLVFAKVLLVVATFAVVVTAYRRGAFIASGVGLILLTWAARPMTLAVRPQLWTFFLLAVLCRVLMGPPRRAWLAVIPAMFALWVNFHGGWIMGFAVLGVWVCCRVWSERELFPLSFGILLIALSAAATLVNPYGWRMWVFLWQTVQMTRDISEWQPIWTSPGISWVPVALMAAITLCWLVSRHRPTFDRVAVILLLAYGATKVRRTAPMFVATALILLAPEVNEFFMSRRAKMWTFTAPSRSGAVLAGLAAACVVIAAMQGTAETLRCISIEGEWIPDQPAAAALKSSRARGRLINSFAWGEYALWHLSPDLKVSIDGRRETLYSEKVLEENRAVERSEPAGIAFLQRTRPDYVWLPQADSPLKDWLRLHGYRIDLDTTRSFIAARADAPGISESAVVPSACFPGL